ncbi:MAG TPA: peptidoglycan bridge formation glycyltransferase FemA/FemB family protein [Flavobacterium sp.]|uniref:lipid II:glycine glycyltransferase FemX n=1 Tax=unclassified Flavobacterium TaxID=196869 RepID=UPI0025C1A19E|nr:MULTISPECIES: peptidoglycan bridge formation glycyltransferase FemA/FemB family protein [unclassified Flavobacterium]HRE78354.1 peptidoglycan bridge formation glycyltransferase FemA/FemB family protein [Flavobacterium sp.]
MEIVFSKDKLWLDKWDSYVINEDRGSHLLLSDWNKSFYSYGFDFEIGILLDNDKIIGGFAAVIAKAFVFKFYIIPYGPIVSLGYEECLNELIEATNTRAKYHKTCYCHINIPITETQNLHTLSAIDNLSSLKSAQKGHVFKYVYSTNGLNWVDLKSYNEESKLNSLKSSVRRDIRSSYRKDLQFEIIETNQQIEEAYRLYLENAKSANYSIRDWNDIKTTLFELQKKNVLKILVVRKENQIKGSILLIKSGNYYTYILGGTKREKPDLLAGHFLQWEAIKLSLNENHSGYNISLGGSKGVFEFKNSFNTEQFYFKGGQYHWVINSNYFKLYQMLEKHLKKKKKKISSLLKFLKRK